MSLASGFQCHPMHAFYIWAENTLRETSMKERERGNRELSVSPWSRISCWTASKPHSGAENMNRDLIMTDQISRRKHRRNESRGYNAN